MKHNYQQAMDKIRFRNDFVQNTIAAIQEKKSTTYHIGLKTALTGVAACACLAMLFMSGIVLRPGKTGHTAPLRQGNAIAISPGSNVTAYVSLPSDHQTAMVLPCSALSLQKEDNALPATPGINLPVIEFENETVTGLAGIDLMVTGDDFSSITFTSEHNVFFHEDPRNWTAEDGTATWSEYRMFLADDRVSAQPTREEIINALSAMQFSGREDDAVVIHQFVDHIYAEESSRIALQGGNVEAFLNEKLLEPIAFSQYDITFYHTDDSDKGSLTESGWSVILRNPANSAIAPEKSRSITVCPGEYVTWTFKNAPQLIGLKRQTLETSALSDEITVTVTTKSGQTREQKWNISFDREGYLVVTECNKNTTV